jgi:hypothetical protein
LYLGGCGTTGTRFTGALDDIVIYNRALTETEIKMLYRAVSPLDKPATPDIKNGLTAWYPLNGNGNDLSGSNHHGTLSQVTFSTDRFGNADHAGVFDASKPSRVLVPSFDASAYKGVTIAAWVNTTMTSPHGSIVQGPPGVVYIGWLQGGKFMGAFDGTGNNNASGDVSTSDVNTGQWVHIAATNDGFITTLYVNGVEENTYQEVLSTFNGEMYIGGNGPTGPSYTGKLDDVVIYNRALSAKEVEMLAQADWSGIFEGSKPQTYVRVYPNPVAAGTDVKVMLPKPGARAEIRLVNSTGQIVKTVSANTDKTVAEITTSGLSSGIYILQLTTGESIATQKIVIR